MSNEQDLINNNSEEIEKKENDENETSETSKGEDSQPNKIPDDEKTSSHGSLHEKQTSHDSLHEKQTSHDSLHEKQTKNQDSNDSYTDESDSEISVTSDELDESYDLLNAFPTLNAILKRGRPNDSNTRKGGLSRKIGNKSQLNLSNNLMRKRTYARAFDSDESPNDPCYSGGLKYTRYNRSQSRSRPDKSRGRRSEKSKGKSRRRRVGRRK